MIAKLHYISQETPQLSHVQAIQNACEAGCDWIQLRVKNTTDEMYTQIATQARQICDTYGAHLIINDNVTVAKAVQAYGVHLGKEDMPPEEARKVLGSQYIIGGTANTFEDVQRLAAAQVDYIGLGPFRFTTTKEKLSPVLRIEGYRQIIEKARLTGISIPIIAIGGIVVDDVTAILATGVHGVAISGLITHATNQKQTVTQLHHALGIYL
jgi:thiamine-phosphate pyrophosphorylase